MKRPSFSVHRAARFAAIPVSLLVGCSLVWTASYSAFTASTTNGPNTWATGTVLISDNDGGTALFPLGAAGNTGLKPDTLSAITIAAGVGPGQVAVAGSRGSACIKVGYTGTVNSTVHLWSALTDTDSLGSEILLTVDTKPGLLADAADPTCAAFPAAPTNIYGPSVNSTIKLSGLPVSYAAASPLTWAATPNTYLWYRFNWMLPSSADVAQATVRSVTANLTWEAHSD